MEQRLREYAGKINRRLEELTNVLAEKDSRRYICAEAMKYSLSAGGKRIRPVLVMEFCRILCGNEDIALDTACALEMIHTFSLIHDDLPCMDNDDMRRGKPSCHKAFGEDIALLAGDALENYAFEVIASDEGLSCEQRVQLIKELSRAVGVSGMIGGQVIDMQNTDSALNGEELLEMYSLKTGALISCACKMGCICAGKPGYIDSAERYAHALGLAFQIKDDILDITADEKELGKPVRSDEASGKATYPAVFGLEAAEAKQEELIRLAARELEGFPDSGFLSELTEYLLRRRY